jgi:PAS domain S-box-containing protein
MPAHVYVRDLDGRFILVNRQYQEFWGVPHDAIRGKTLAETDRISEVDLTPSVNEQIDREVLVTREPCRREARVIRRGKEHVLSDMRFPVVDGAGELVALAGIDIDITTQKRAEAELVRRTEAARDAAIEATAAKSRLLATMGRQLREPLKAIVGSIRAAQDAEQIDDLGELLVSAEHLLGLIDEISDLAELDANLV